MFYSFVALVHFPQQIILQVFNSRLHYGEPGGQQELQLVPREIGFHLGHHRKALSFGSHLRHFRQHLLKVQGRQDVVHQREAVYSVSVP